MGGAIRGYRHVRDRSVEFQRRAGRVSVPVLRWDIERDSPGDSRLPLAEVRLLSCAGEQDA